jgi:hypothetical protein
MTDQEVLDKFDAMEEELWKLAERIAELEKEKSANISEFRKLMEQGN